MKAVRMSQGVIAHPVMESERGMCLAGHPLEAQAGAAMLAAGGNAVDAAVARITSYNVCYTKLLRFSV